MLYQVLFLKYYFYKILLDALASIWTVFLILYIFEFIFIWKATWEEEIESDLFSDALLSRMDQDSTRSPELNSDFPDDKDASIWAIICRLQGCVLAGTWIWSREGSTQPKHANEVT